MKKDNGFHKFSESLPLESKLFIVDRWKYNLGIIFANNFISIHIFNSISPIFAGHNNLPLKEEYGFNLSYLKFYNLKFSGHILSVS